MIARSWHGKVPTPKAAAYHQYLLATGLKDYAAVKGNISISLLTREEDGITHFYTFTYWQSIDAIKAFAGEDYQEARYYPEDGDFLLEKERMVTHYEVLEHIQTS
jgi:heme-degrading monooxygenase HmoA